VVASSGRLAAPALAAPGHVSNCGDSAAGSLRAVVGAATSGDTIVFDLACTGASQITLSSEIPIGTKLTIDGTGHAITISGGDASRIFNVGAAGTLTLKSLTLTHGAAGQGAALYNTGTLTLLNSTISASTASASPACPGCLPLGGAIANFNGATLTVQGSTFVGNTAAAPVGETFGGAIYNDTGTVTIQTSSFTGNHASVGAGVQISSGPLTVLRSTFAGNTAEVGAAIHAGCVLCGGPEAGPQVTLANSTVTNNTGQIAGAFFVQDDAAAFVYNDTFAGNHGGEDALGSEISAQGLTAVANTIVTGNSGKNCAGAIVDYGNNLRFGDGGDDTSCPFGNQAVTSDPLLGNLADNGGPTQTMALGPGSPALSAGNPFQCGVAPIGNIDQRGQPRNAVDRNTCDIGAYDTGKPARAVASPSTTTISCADCAIPVGGKTTSMTVQAKTASGEPLTVGGDTVALAATQGTLSAVTDNANGTYTASLKSPKKPGTATILGTINGDQIASTATVKFTAAQPAGGTTTITAGPVNVALAGGQTRIVVDTRDRFGNDVPRGGARVKLKASAGKVRIVRDLHNGDYTATLSRNKAKDQKVVITGRINGAHIRDNAVVFFK
jgi:hypothetical protein